LDGGGYRGVFSVAVLAGLEEDLGVELLDHFDLVAGTSTGGIIALALGAGMRPSEILDFYLEEGTSIFPSGRLRTARRLSKAKYSEAPLRRAVEKVFGDRCLWESRVPLCIPSYDLRSDDVYLFRTPHSKRLARDWRERMADIALATSAAPTYLPGHHLRQLRLVDGGVWVNNPSLLAVAEAVSEFGIDLRDIRVLSLGTTNDLGVHSDRLDGGGLWAWKKAAIPLFLRGQSRAAENATFHLLPRGQFVRIDPDVPKNVLRLDWVNPEELRGRAETESRKKSELVSDTFLCHRAAPYTPCHTPQEKP
jgi:patatin-like phospholipase/acyl hydrolase